MRYKYYKNERGVSLIELLVAIMIFSVLILSATGIFKMVVDGQRSSISAQNTQENIRYAMEKISKEIRMAQISNTDCLPAPAGVNKVFNTANGNSELYFKNKNGQCVTYYLENNRLKIIVGGIDDYITSAKKVEVSNLKFYAVDNEINPPPGAKSVQPYLTMAMNVKAIGPAIHEQKMKIQLTVSSRYYE